MQRMGGAGVFLSANFDHLLSMGQGAYLLSLGGGGEGGDIRKIYLIFIFLTLSIV